MLQSLIRVDYSDDYIDIHLTRSINILVEYIIPVRSLYTSNWSLVETRHWSRDHGLHQGRTAAEPGRGEMIHLQNDLVIHVYNYNALKST